MCGRFSLAADLEEILWRFAIESVTCVYVPRFNIAPGQWIPAIIAHSGKNRLGQLRWGLIPSWAKDERNGAKLINAKAETIRVKPAFRQSFLRKRCIIPADGFYEWKTTPSGKQAMHIRMKTGKLFAMAGLFDTWTAPDGKKVHTCTIITTQANDLLAPIHDRMPVILRADEEALWLDRNEQNGELLQSLLTPYPAAEMEAYPVTPKVGNVKFDSPVCIQRYEENGGNGHVEKHV